MTTILGESEVNVNGKNIVSPLRTIWYHRLTKKKHLERLWVFTKKYSSDINPKLWWIQHCMDLLHFASGAGYFTRSFRKHFHLKTVLCQYKWNIWASASLNSYPWQLLSICWKGVARIWFRLPKDEIPAMHWHKEWSSRYTNINQRYYCELFTRTRQNYQTFVFHQTLKINYTIPKVTQLKAF